MSIAPEISTEQKIKDVARIIFTKKGFLATTIRDIATEADINVASINYHFGSKENLFAFIMDETIKNLFDKIEPVFNDETTTIAKKIELCVGYYIDQILENPDFIFFMVNEVMGGSTKLPMINNMRSLVNSYFAKQLLALQITGGISFHPVNIMWNMAGMITFPFLSRPQILQSGSFNQDEFLELMLERKKLIPVWIKMMMNL
jgi:AcrR family transcriptional regulator